MTLNKQGKNVSFEIRYFELNKKGEKEVQYSEEAYLKQRRILNPEMFKGMNTLYLSDFYFRPKEIKNKNGINLRVTKIKINENLNECLVSNLDTNESTKEDLKEIYAKRWEAENSYNSIKNKLKIEEFTGNLPQFIYQ